MRRYTEELKTAWIDTDNHIIAFHELPGSTIYREKETSFWEQILALLNSGYSVT